MLHPLLTPLGGGTPTWLASIGPYGAWSDLTIKTRWGQGASGMFEASFAMPLPPDFEHPLLTRGTRVALIDGGYQLGSSLVMASPGRGSGLSEPWTVECTGLGREVEGSSSYYAFDVSGNATAVPSLAVDRAKLAGWWITGYNNTVPSTAIGAVANTDSLQTVGALLDAAGQQAGAGVRWLVDNTDSLTYAADPVTPSYHVIPGVAQLGTADDDYYSVIWCNYIDSGVSNTYQRVYAINGQTDAKFGRREQAVDLSKLGPISSTTAQAFANGILGELGGRLSWLGDITGGSNEILTAGGVPADLTMLLEDVGRGCMVRLHGVWDDLLEFTGNTYIDVVIGEATYTDGDQTIQLKPLGAAARDLASVIERVTGLSEAA